MKLRFTKNGFTLSEVLITLGIIGVVAALTIPALISSYQKKVLATQPQKDYAVIQTGFKQYMADNNCMDLACTNFFVGLNSATAWRNNALVELPKIFSNAQIYGYGYSNSFAHNSLGDTSNVETSSQYGSGYAFQLADGSLIAIDDSDANNCERFSTYPGAKLYNACGDVYIDVNGFKPPNVLGRDFFRFYIGNDGLLYPYQGIEDNNIGGAYWADFSTRCGTRGSSTLASNVRGWGCAARIMENSWEMDY